MPATVAGFVYLKFTPGTALPLFPVEGLPIPPSPVCSKCPTLFAMCLFGSLFIIQFFLFFFQGMGHTVQGTILILSQGWLWGYHVPLMCSPVCLHLPG
jgi:hypothetical protein